MASIMAMADCEITLFRIIFLNKKMLLYFESIIPYN